MVRTVCREPLAIRSFRPVFDTLSLLILLQHMNQNLVLARLRLPMLPSGQRVHRCGALWPRRASSAPCSPCVMLALPTGVVAKPWRASVLFLVRVWALAFASHL